MDARAGQSIVNWGSRLRSGRGQQQHAVSSGSGSNDVSGTQGAESELGPCLKGQRPELSHGPGRHEYTSRMVDHRAGHPARRVTSLNALARLVPGLQYHVSRATGITHPEKTRKTATEAPFTHSPMTLASSRQRAVSSQTVSTHQGGHDWRTSPHTNTRKNTEYLP